MKSWRGPIMTFFAIVIIGGALALKFVPPRTGPPPPLLPMAVPSPAPSIQARQSPPAPARFAAQIEALGRGFDGQVGIAVQSIEEGWVAAFNGTRPFPQQSVSKLWVAGAVMDRIDAGELSRGTTIPLTAADLTVFHQPIRKKILGGYYAPPISELLFFAMTQSDNAANEALFRRVGGKAGVEGFLARKDLNGITMSAGERELQTEIAGLTWNPAYSYGRTFWAARNGVPWEARRQALLNYVAGPRDGATPVAVAQSLARLQKGELLSARSTATLLDLMAQSKTGPDRLKSGLAPGWAMAHKTGTGQVLQLLTNEHAGIITAYNDVGLLTSPQGKHYAIAVMIGQTMRSVPQRQALMRAVTQAVIACETRGCR